MSEADLLATWNVSTWIRRGDESDEQARNLDRFDDDVRAEMNRRGFSPAPGERVESPLTDWEICNFDGGSRSAS